MAVFIKSIEAVTLLILMMGTGYFLGYKGWMTPVEKGFLGKFIVNFAVPCTCITGLVGNLSRSLLLEASTILAASFCAVLLNMVLGILVSHWVALPHRRQGVFASMVGLSNCLFIGLPVITQIFGDEGIPYLMVYYLINTTVLQTVVMTLIQRSGDLGGPAPTPLSFVIELLKKPPFWGIIISVVVIWFDLSIPSLLWTYAGYMGGTVSPLALIYCGFVLYEVGLRNLHFEQGLPLMLVLRLMAAPALTYAIAMAFQLDPLPAAVLTLAGGLPVVSQVTVFAGAFGADEEYAAVGATLSTLFCCVSIPLVMALVG